MVGLGELVSGSVTVTTGDSASLGDSGLWSVRLGLVGLDLPAPPPRDGEALELPFTELAAVSEMDSGTSFPREDFNVGFPVKINRHFIRNSAQ